MNSNDPADAFAFSPQASAFHPILFVGAGPGDPELITVKGRKALETADLVIYSGSLVPEALLGWCRPGTPALNSASMHLQEIIAAMEEAHRAGKKVVRLHTGDPSLYGAIHEQTVELRRRGIPFQIIPGVTAAFAAAAALGIEFTLPEIAQTLILTRIAGRTPVPEAEGLAGLAAHKTSMAIYLSLGQVEEVAKVLGEAYGENAPCAVVCRASQPGQRVILTQLKDLPVRVKAEGITRQAIILAGPALQDGLENMGLRSKLYDQDFVHGFRK